MLMTNVASLGLNTVPS